MKSIKLKHTKTLAFTTVQMLMLAIAGAFIMTGGEALAFSTAVQGVGTEICNVYKAVKNYIAPAVAVLLFGIAFIEMKTGNRNAQARATAVFFGALFFANIGAIVQLTKLPITNCPA